MPLPGIRAATSFLDELQRDLLETEDQDFDGFFDRWSALGVPEIEEYRGDRRRSRGEVIAEVGKTRRAIEKRPEILREAETGDSPILTGARRIARGADVLEGLMRNGGNGASTLTPVSGPAPDALPDAMSFATSEFAPGTTPEITGIAAGARNKTVFDNGFSVNLNDTSSTPEDRTENDAAVDAGAGLSESETRNKCEYLQLQIIFWQRQEVAQRDEWWRVEDEINDLRKLRKKRKEEIPGYVSPVDTVPGDSHDKGKGDRGSDNKKSRAVKALKTIMKYGGGIVGKLPDLLAIQKKGASIDEIDERIFALEWEQDGIEFELAATEQLIAEATNEFKNVPCKWDFSLGYSG